MLEIHLFARFEVKIDGGPVELPSRQAQSLLAYLLLNLGIQQRRDKVAGMLWPESEESKARTKLRYALWRLRKTLGEEYFLADKISLTFNPEADFWLDTAVIDRKLSLKPSTLELKEIVSVYQGDLLPGFYEDWVLLERERLSASFEQKMELFLDRLMEEQSWREVLEWGESWIAMGQAPEHAFRALMIAHSHLGDSASAANAYHRLSQTLEEQLGVEPSSESQQLYDRISRGDLHDLTKISEGMATETTPDEIAPPDFLTSSEGQRRKELQPFVGREEELSRLTEFMKQACDGQGQMVFIVGDAGRGKTSLLREFSRQAHQQWEDLIVAFGQAEANTGIGDPNLPFRDVLALLCGDVRAKWESGDLSRENAERLWDLIPLSIQSLLDEGPDLIGRFVNGRSLISRGTAFDSRGARWLERLRSYVEVQRLKPEGINVSHGDPQTALFEQYVRVLHNLAAEHPLLLILDDLQWADTGSIGQLFHLSRRIEGQRILIIGAFRSDAIFRGGEDKPHPLLQVVNEVKRKHGQVEIDLNQSDEMAGRSFVDAVLDHESNNLSESFRQELYTRTSGHPLFTVELLQQLKADGDLFQDENGCWIAAEEIDWGKIPVKVDAVIEGRIGQVPKELRELLNIASVEGEKFTAEVLASVAERSTQSIIRVLSQELDKQFNLVEAYEVQRVGSQRISRYRFRHHLFQKYLFENLDPVERVQLHEAIGGALEDLYGESRNEIAVNLAMHFDEAGLAEKAFNYRFEAGEQAKWLSANQEAIYHFDRANQLLEKLPQSPEKAQKELALQLSRGSAMVAARGWAVPEVEEIYARARVLSVQAGETEQLIYALWGLWSFYLTQPKHREAINHADRILQLALEEEDPIFIMVGHWSVGISHIHLGDFALARDHLERAVELYDLEKHAALSYLFGQNPGITCLTYLAIDLSILGYLDQALDISHRALSLVEQEPHLFSKAFGYGLTSVMYALQREPKQALANAEKAISIAKEKGFPFFIGLGAVIKVWALAELGDPRVKIRLMERGTVAMQATGAELGEPFFQSLLVQALLRAGKSEKALGVISKARAVAEHNDEHWIDAELLRLEGNIRMVMGEDETQLLQSWESAIEKTINQDSKLFELRTRMELAKLPGPAGDVRKRIEELAETFAWFEEGMASPDLLEAREILKSLEDTE